MITYFIIGLTILTSLRGFKDHDFFRKWEFNPYLVKHSKERYRIFTHAFLHGDWMHLFVNMFVLWQFGTQVESAFRYYFGDIGIVYFLSVYFGGIMVASMPALQRHSDNHLYSAIGASGAVSAILFSYIVMEPVKQLYLFAILPLPSIVFGALYLIYERRLDKRNVNDNIAHDAHFYGAIFGVLITIVFRYEWLFEFFEKIGASLSWILG